MKRADGSGAEIAVILGDDELAAGEASVKTLRSQADGSPGGQRRVPLDALADNLVQTFDIDVD